MTRHYIFAVLFSTLAFGFSVNAASSCDTLTSQTNGADAASCGDRVAAGDGDLDVEVEATLRLDVEGKYRDAKTGLLVTGETWYADIKCVGDAADCEALGLVDEPYSAPATELVKFNNDIKERVQQLSDAAETKIEAIQSCEIKDGKRLVKGSALHLVCLTDRLVSMTDEDRANEFYLSPEGLYAQLKALLESDDISQQKLGAHYLQELYKKLLAREKDESKPVFHMINDSITYLAGIVKYRTDREKLLAARNAAGIGSAEYVKIDNQIRMMDIQAGKDFKGFKNVGIDPQTVSDQEYLNRMATMEPDASDEEAVEGAGEDLKADGTTATEKETWNTVEGTDEAASDEENDDVTAKKPATRKRGSGTRTADDDGNFKATPSMVKSTGPGVNMVQMPKDPGGTGSVPAIDSDVQIF